MLIRGASSDCKQITEARRGGQDIGPRCVGARVLPGSRRNAESTATALLTRSPRPVYTYVSIGRVPLIGHRTVVIRDIYTAPSSNTHGRGCALRASRAFIKDVIRRSVPL